MFIYMAVMYWIIRRFGSGAQAGFGIGQRIMQSMFLPAMAVAFATAPIVGQNFGAGKFDRVRQTFALAALISGCIMVPLTLFCQWRAGWLIHAFTADPAAMSVGTQFLEVVSWNFLASGIVFTCSSVFQGLGHTVPAVLSSASRLVSFVVPALWLAASTGFRLLELWYISIASVTLQAVLSLWLVRSELRRRAQPPLEMPA
jgi:Na+-driven multidrug efflux pump